MCEVLTVSVNSATRRLMAIRKNECAVTLMLPVRRSTRNAKTTWLASVAMATSAAASTPAPKHAAALLTGRRADSLQRRAADLVPAAASLTQVPMRSKVVFLTLEFDITSRCCPSICEDCDKVC